MDNGGVLIGLVSEPLLAEFSLLFLFLCFFFRVCGGRGGQWGEWGGILFVDE